MGRGLAGIAAEDFLEVALVAETAVEGDKTEFPVRPGEQFAGAVDAHLVQ